MAIIDSYRNSKNAKQRELAKLASDKAKEFVKLSDLNKKINSASDAMRRTKSISTINSKLRDIERYNKDVADTNKKIADFESKIVRKEKEISDYQTKIDKEWGLFQKWPHLFLQSGHIFRSKVFTPFRLKVCSGLILRRFKTLVMPSGPIIHSEH